MSCCIKPTVTLADDASKNSEDVVTKTTWMGILCSLLKFAHDPTCGTSFWRQEKEECVQYMHCLKTDGRPTVHGLLLAPTSIMEMLPYIQDGTSPHWKRWIVAALFRWMYHWWFIDLLGYNNFRLCPQWKSRFQWRVFFDAEATKRGTRWCPSFHFGFLPCFCN